MKAAAVVLSMCAICAWLSAAAAGPDKPGSAATRTVDVTMPGGTATFPPGDGADRANSQCVQCHSVGMVTRQPTLSFDE